MENETRAVKWKLKVVQWNWNWN